MYTIHFFYKGEKVTKEIWYDGSSSNVSDEVYYTYNRRGQNTRVESFLGDYYTVNTFDAVGNLTAWDFYVGGNLTYSSRSTFSHRHPYKNPRRAMPGIDYGFPLIYPVQIFPARFVLPAKNLLRMMRVAILLYCIIMIRNGQAINLPRKTILHQALFLTS